MPFVKKDFTATVLALFIFVFYFMFVNNDLGFLKMDNRSAFVLFSFLGFLMTIVCSPENALGVDGKINFQSRMARILGICAIFLIVLGIITGSKIMLTLLVILMLAFWSYTIARHAVNR